MKNILIVIGVVVLAAIAYWLMSERATAPTTEDATPDISVEEVDVVAESAAVPPSTTEVMPADTTAADNLESGDKGEATVKEFTLDSFNFGYSMDVIEVNEGDTVTINLTSSDGFHDWVVDEFDAATEKINVGEETSVTFVADAAGTYEFYCSVGSHRARGMVGTLIVN
ncbi:MAG TPA: cupredoxin domain-containing protein [Candidatus Paceibacterota bacterium]|nr:cupredoxin domain-containing protein [Candidatus Paceibacterota bacterium]